MNAVLRGLDEAQLADADTWHMVLAQCVATFKARDLKLAKKAASYRVVDDTMGSLNETLLRRWISHNGG